LACDVSGIRSSSSEEVLREGDEIDTRPSGEEILHDPPRVSLEPNKRRNGDWKRQNFPGPRPCGDGRKEIHVQEQGFSAKIPISGSESLHFHPTVLSH
jgi:hypothetical protein